MEIANTPSNFPIIEQFKQKKPLFIIGSAHPKDIDLLLPFIEKNTIWKVLLVPHEVDTKSIQKIQQLLPKALLYTKSKATDNDVKEANILIVNTIGILSQLYRYADIAYIGGGFDTGIHNILEPAVFGISTN